MLVHPTSDSSFSSLSSFSLEFSVTISPLSLVSSRLVQPPSSPLAPAASRRKKSKRSILLQLHEAKTDKGGPASLADCHLLAERSILQLRLLLAVVKQWRGPKEEGTVQFMCQDAQLRYREVVSSKGGDKVDVKGGRRLSQCPGVRMAEWPSPFNP